MGGALDSSNYVRGCKKWPLYTSEIDLLLFHYLQAKVWSILKIEASLIHVF
jgi:hypothetical protein